jgi:predicted secreted protein
LPPRLSALLLASCLCPGQTISSDTAASSRQKPSWSLNLQTGFAETFQLTLGGMFGRGPAWQNRVQINLSNAFRNGDAVSVYGWQTHNTPDHANDWDAGIWYRTPLVRSGVHFLQGGAGIQRWRFPSVKCGAQDWLSAFNLTYQTRVGRLPLTVLSDSRTLHVSPLPKGTLLHSQAYTQHKLYQRDELQLLLRHGPQHTYSWNFYGTNGHRVVRYMAAAVVVWKDTAVEAAYRKQLGLQRGIPGNNFWSVMVSRSF